VGGSAREWRTALRADLPPAATVELRLVMTKFGAPPVDVAYEVRLEPA
jgi:hypothetical protein